MKIKKFEVGMIFNIDKVKMRIVEIAHRRVLVYMKPLIYNKMAFSGGFIWLKKKQIREDIKKKVNYRWIK